MLKSNLLRNKVFRPIKRLNSIAVDCHTHMYTPKYMNILKNRVKNPRIISIAGENRLLILPGEEFDPTTSSGEKLNFSFISLFINHIFTGRRIGNEVCIE
jgi:hypothetical protein